jgi:hypothetical protein
MEAPSSACMGWEVTCGDHGDSSPRSLLITCSAVPTTTFSGQAIVTSRSPALSSLRAKCGPNQAEAGGSLGPSRKY